MVFGLFILDFEQSCHYLSCVTMEDDNMKFYEKNVANKKYNRNLSDLKYCPHILMHFVNEIICKKIQYYTVILKKCNLIWIFRWSLLQISLAFESWRIDIMDKFYLKTFAIYYLIYEKRYIVLEFKLHDTRHLYFRFNANHWNARFHYILLKLFWCPRHEVILSHINYWLFNLRG